MQQNKIVILVRTLKNYHHARLLALGGDGGYEVHVIEYVSSGDIGEFNKEEDCLAAYTLHTVFRSHDQFASNRRNGNLHRLTLEILDSIKPAVVAIPGWAHPEALSALSWCLVSGSKALLMSDSTIYDRKRWWWKESIKKRIVALCSAAFVAGTPHVEYLLQLSMPPENVFTGYDVVDNLHFSSLAEQAVSNRSALHCALHLPARFFLTVCRLVPEKNLGFLLDAYSRYKRKAGASAWPLVIVGEGVLAPALLEQRNAYGLKGFVHFPGEKSYSDLPMYYGLSSIFILPSVSETWGLVVNEAMAAGLPVLVSNKCGCAVDLVSEGANGFTFDPFAIDSFVDLMLNMSSEKINLDSMKSASKEIISHWSLEKFATNFFCAIGMAIDTPRPKFTFLDVLFLRVLARL